MVMLRFLSRAPEFLAFPPPPPLLLFALNLPCRLAAAADALSGMVNSDLLLLLLLVGICRLRTTVRIKRSNPRVSQQSDFSVQNNPSELKCCVACFLPYLQIVSGS
jgi:hypothetical protein